MTVKQFRKAVDTARKFGKVRVNGCMLYDHGSFWSLVASDGNVIEAVDDPGDLEYLFD